MSASRLAAAAIVVAALGGGTYYYTQARAIGSGATSLADVKEIEFKDILVFENNHLSNDNGSYREVACGATEKGTVFGFIKLSPTLVGYLSCIDDYMGGTTLSLRKDGKEVASEQIGLSFGDAGEESDMRTYLKRDGDKLRIVQSVIWSQEAIDVPSGKVGEIECGRSSEELTFDESKNVFQRKEITFDPLPFKIGIPPAVNEKCGLD